MGKASWVLLAVPVLTVARSWWSAEADDSGGRPLDAAVPWRPVVPTALDGPASVAWSEIPDLKRRSGHPDHPGSTSRILEHRIEVNASWLDCTE
jgi:hypothetical protein